MGEKENHLEKILTELKGIRGVKAIYLFGSYAKGEEKPISDIDLCAITARSVSERKKLKILSNAGRTIDVSVFWDLPISVKGKVLKEGKLLFCRDERFLSGVFLDTMREYLDFKPVIEKFTKIYLGG